MKRRAFLLMWFISTACFSQNSSIYSFFTDNLLVDWTKIEIPVSDIEKTLIDLVYYKENISKDVILEIKKKIDLIKLNEYLEKYPITIKNKVLDLIK